MNTQRRNRLDLMSPAETAIQNAIWEVEKIGADVRLTKAVNQLSDAKSLVSDFIDDQEKQDIETPPPPPPKP